MDVDVQLRVRHHDILCPELRYDRPMQFVEQHRASVCVHAEYPKLEQDGARPKFGEKDLRRRTFEYGRMRLRDTKQNLAHLFNIGALIDAHL